MMRCIDLLFYMPLHSRGVATPGCPTVLGSPSERTTLRLVRLAPAALPALAAGAALYSRQRGMSSDQDKFPVKKSDAEWKELLSPAEFQVIRSKGTEGPRTGEYDKFYPKPGEGHFVCRACSNPLCARPAQPLYQRQPRPAA